MCFLYFSQEGNCLRCLSIHQKHANVLQYKESKCITERKNYKEICRSISVDEPLKSLFRVNASGVNCPIHGTYSFSYSRGHGLCSYPLSSLHQCSDKSRLVFSYQACVDIKGSQSQTEQAHCIADWKEGSTYYFVAQMNSSHVSTADQESSFRCFVYKEIHSGYRLSQSAEAKCNLYTATEGYRTMSLKRCKDSKFICILPFPRAIHYVSLFSQYFNQSCLFSEGRWQQLSFPGLVHRTSQIPFALIFQCLPNQPSWKCPHP